MNSILFFVCVLAACVTTQGYQIRQLADVLDISRDQFDECVKNNGLNDDDFSKIHPLLFKTEMSEDEKNLMKNFSCFMACTFENAKIMKDDKVELKPLLKIVEKSNIFLNPEIKEILNDCVDEAGKRSDKCDAAFDFSSCMLRKLRYG
ncbi:pheromone-binding protein Gp-9-like [Nomia melanderi]|uniref:pheromone-binding protein Gp-9-like n=1 Tax=Nomia melanderi TaxID=2448451 RepID=UPI0013045BFB|nr:pheromone-binding protein Gp-9-like [Nomia melanderi]